MERPAPEPSAPPTAAVALYGRALRYAEVESAGPAASRLRRLGTCDFDFDVDEAVLGLAGPAHLDTVAAALREVFRETAARTLVVVAHPPRLTSFFSPLPEALPAPRRYEQLRQEAALLADVVTTQPVRIRAVPVRTEVLRGEGAAGPHRWHHVLHVPEPVHARLSLLARALGLAAYDLVDATQAAAAVVGALDAPAAGAGAYALAVGTYPGHAEFALCRRSAAAERPRWHFGHHAPNPAAAGSPEDAAYFALALLERLGLALDDVGRLYVYGEDAGGDGHARLGALLGRAPEPLDPLPVFGRAIAGVSPAALAAFAPCLGAALR